MVSSESAGTSANCERLSALVDGELDAGDVAHACALWRDQGELRSTWHAYQLIGDVLRSEDLASNGTRDSAFVAALRVRLASEPVVLAPAPVARPAPARTRRRAWMAPVAAAAGVAAVAVVVTVMRGSEPSVAVATGAVPAKSVASLAQGSQPLAVATSVQAPAPVASTVLAPVQPEPVAETINVNMVRDARLDYYLRWHQQFSGSSALAGQGFLRAATAEGRTGGR